MSINELSKYCCSREECEKIYKRYYYIIYIIYRLKNLNLDEISTYNFNLNKNKYQSQGTIFIPREITEILLHIVLGYKLFKESSNDIIF